MSHDNKEEFDKFMAGSTAISSKPKKLWAKRIISVKCLNPDEKILGFPNRSWEVEFEDGSKFTRGEAYWRNFSDMMEPGNYVVMSAPDIHEIYLTPSKFREEFDIL